MHRFARAVLPAVLCSAFACDTTSPPPSPPPPRSEPLPAARPAAPPEPEIQQTVARISLVAGNVSISRGDDPDSWNPAEVNVPLTLGDRVWTGEDGRIELQVHGGNLVRLPARTDLQLLNLTGGTQQFSLATGTASVTVRRLGEDEVFEVDTPNAAVTLERPGEYRVDVDPEGSTRIQAQRGRAIAFAGGGQVALAAGQQASIEGAESPRYEVAALPPPDGWDRWVEDRDRRLAEIRSYAYVTADVAGVEDLDQYGRWQQIPEYGWAWTPSVVEIGWAPYRTGRWIWQDPWGWTWVAAEPWGWAPYHYGRWAYSGTGWYWVPVGPTVPAVAYSPAMVAFVGGTGGYVGWFPLAPRDPFYPWWGRRNAAVQVGNVTYVNRTYVTVVNETVFVSGRSVARDVVRDRTVVRSVESAPVLRGPVPVVPTRASLGLTRAASAPRPPVSTGSRTIVTRAVPPPPPPRFDAKLPVIREKGGSPVPPSEAARLSAQAPAGAAPRTRSAAPASGAVTLAPRSTGRPEPGPPAPARAAAPPPERPTPIPPAGRPTPARHDERTASPPARPTAIRPAPVPTAAPERGTERSVPAPAVRERPQPAERIAPEPKSHGSPKSSRPTPRPTPTRSPKT
jgi:hypothetical protein